MGKILSDIKSTYVFLGQTPKATEIKAKINQWDLIKLTSFAQQRKPKRKQKDNFQNGRKLFETICFK